MCSRNRGAVPAEMRKLFNHAPEVRQRLKPDRRGRRLRGHVDLLASPRRGDRPRLPHGFAYTSDPSFVDCRVLRSVRYALSDSIELAIASSARAKGNTARAKTGSLGYSLHTAIAIAPDVISAGFGDVVDQSKTTSQRSCLNWLKIGRRRSRKRSN